MRTFSKSFGRLNSFNLKGKRPGRPDGRTQSLLDVDFEIAERVLVVLQLEEEREREYGLLPGNGVQSHLENESVFREVLRSLEFN
jgi:hypothetical protein